jgi:DNA-binding MarR family transcriptional regulator
MSSSDESGPNVGGILANLWALIEAVVGDSEEALEALGLSPKAFFLLEAVGDAPFPAELARRMHLPPPTVTYLVKQLEAKGFLERRAEPGDLRKFRLVPTPLGRDALRRGREALSVPMAERLRRLSPKEAASFDRTVRRLAGRNGGDGSE